MLLALLKPVTLKCGVTLRCGATRMNPETLKIFLVRSLRVYMQATINDDSGENRDVLDELQSSPSSSSSSSIIAS